LNNILMLQQGRKFGLIDERLDQIARPQVWPHR
jgi:hypothetical protein